MSDLTTRSREAAQRDIAVAALQVMLLYFDRPQRDEWLTDAGFQGALAACQRANNALTKIAEIEKTAPAALWPPMEDEPE